MQVLPGHNGQMGLPTLGSAKSGGFDFLSAAGILACMRGSVGEAPVSEGTSTDGWHRGPASWDCASCSSSGTVEGSDGEGSDGGHGRSAKARRTCRKGRAPTSTAEGVAAALGTRVGQRRPAATALASPLRSTSRRLAQAAATAPASPASRAAAAALTDAKPAPAAALHARRSYTWRGVRRPRTPDRQSTRTSPTQPALTLWSQPAPPAELFKPAGVAEVKSEHASGPTELDSAPPGRRALEAAPELFSPPASGEPSLSSSDPRASTSPGAGPAGPSPDGSAGVGAPLGATAASCASSTSPGTPSGWAPGPALAWQQQGWGTSPGDVAAGALWSATGPRSPPQPTRACPAGSPSAPATAADADADAREGDKEWAALTTWLRMNLHNPRTAKKLVLFVGCRDPRTSRWAFDLNPELTWEDVSPDARARLGNLLDETRRAFRRKYPNRPPEAWTKKAQKYRPPGSQAAYQVSLDDLVLSLHAMQAREAAKAARHR